MQMSPYGTLPCMSAIFRASPYEIRLSLPGTILRWSLACRHVDTFLCAARAEALFADLGHFSKGTIRVCECPSLLIFDKACFFSQHYIGRHIPFPDGVSLHL